MLTYPKINSLFKRDDKGRFIEMKWSQPEFEYLQHLGWTLQEKVDGTNMRVGFRHTDNDIISNVYREEYPEDNLVMYIGGRTNRAQIPGDLLEKMKPYARQLKRFLVDNFAGVDPDFPVTYYGEGFGAGIQKVGNMYLPHKDFCLFDVRIGENIWLEQSAVKELAKHLDMMYPPILAEGWTLMETVDFVRDTKERFATPPCSTLVGHAPIEGYILRPSVELSGKRGRIISKIKYVDKFWD